MFDPSLYEEPQAPTAQAKPVVDPGPSSLVGPGQRVGGRQPSQSGNSPVAIAFLGAGVVALAVSTGGAIPDIQHKIDANRAVSARLTQEGLSNLSESEIDKLVKTAIPLVNVNGELTALNWQQVKSLRLSPGTYTTGASIYFIAMVGPGKVGENNPVIGHKVGALTPEQRRKIIENAQGDGGVWQVVQSLRGGEPIPVVSGLRINRPNR
jgi:hypothetical protein